MNENSTFRILSLEGGGVRGVVSATILRQVESQIRDLENKSLTEYFDMVAGTSTGAILAAGIVLGRTPEDMINVYRNRGNEIFDRGTRRCRKLIPGGGGYFIPFTRYKNKGLITVLEEELLFPEGGESPKLIDVENREELPTLLILAYDTLNGYTQYFDSNGKYKDNRQPMWYTEQYIWEICVCSAAAPTFFPPYELEYIDRDGEEISNTYIDGGVAANNPDLAAITHALYTKTRQNSPTNSPNTIPPGLALSDISVLSIGTGKINQPFDFKTVNEWGLIEWAKKIPDIFLAAPADFEQKVTRQLISTFNQNTQYLRINIDLEKSFAAIDDPDIINNLITETEKYLPSCEEQLQITYYDYEAGDYRDMNLENLVNDFIINNHRESDRDFRNRF